MTLPIAALNDPLFFAHFFMHVAEQAVATRQRLSAFCPRPKTLMEVFEADNLFDQEETAQ